MREHVIVSIGRSEYDFVCQSGCSSVYTSWCIVVTPRYLFPKGKVTISWSRDDFFLDASRQSVGNAVFFRL